MLLQGNEILIWLIALTVVQVGSITVAIGAWARVRRRSNSARGNAVESARDEPSAAPGVSDDLGTSRIRSDPGHPPGEVIRPTLIEVPNLSANRAGAGADRRKELYARIRRLSESGASAREIADVVGLRAGQVEVILRLGGSRPSRAVRD